MVTSWEQERYSTASKEDFGRYISLLKVWYRTFELAHLASYVKNWIKLCSSPLPRTGLPLAFSTTKVQARYLRANLKRACRTAATLSIIAEP